MTITATIKWDNKNNHPDSANIKGMAYSDVYTIDNDRFYSTDDAISYVKNDLALVAGGGYDTDTIENVKFDIKVSA